jgi:hypothetical protein
MLVVSERGREMAVRLAIGAAPRELIRLVVFGAARLLAGGIAAGVLLALVARVVNRFGARRRARRARHTLHERIATVANELVLDPLEAELTAHAELLRALGRALGDGPAAPGTQLASSTPAAALGAAIGSAGGRRGGGQRSTAAKS